MVNESKNPLVLSFTNKTAENVKERLIKDGYDKTQSNEICFTLNGKEEI